MIKLICPLDSFKYYKTPVEEYLKRLWKNFEFIKLKPSKKNTVIEILKEESIALSNELKKQKWFKILLFIEWEHLDTMELFNFIENKKQNYQDIIFVIWWAYGVNYDFLKEDIDLKLSLSKLTFSHLEALLILLEQIYRCETISKGSSYHH